MIKIKIIKRIKIICELLTFRSFPLSVSELIFTLIFNVLAERVRALSSRFVNDTLTLIDLFN